MVGTWQLEENILIIKLGNSLFCHTNLTIKCVAVVCHISIIKDTTSLWVSAKVKRIPWWNWVKWQENNPVPLKVLLCKRYNSLLFLINILSSSIILQFFFFSTQNWMLIIPFTNLSHFMNIDNLQWKYDLLISKLILNQYKVQLPFFNWTDCRHIFYFTIFFSRTEELFFY